MTVWRRSQKVVCIYDGPWADFNPEDPSPCPKKGPVYEIWEVLPHPKVEGYFGLHLVEIPGCVYDDRCFRPAVDRPTDISIFTKEPLPTTPNLEPVS